KPTSRSRYHLQRTTYYFSKHTATTELYTLSLHDALPISRAIPHPGPDRRRRKAAKRLDIPAKAIRETDEQPRSIRSRCACPTRRDRKSTRLNSSHDQISYAVFCLKKKKKIIRRQLVLASK